MSGALTVLVVDEDGNQLLPAQAFSGEGTYTVTIPSPMHCGTCTCSTVAVMLT